LLIASSLLLLVVVGTIVAFDGWPTGEPSRADVVAVGRDHAVRARSVTVRRARARTTAERRRAAIVRRRARARAGAATDGSSVGLARPAEPIISGLPGPDSGGWSGQGGTGSGATGGAAQAGGRGGGSGSGSETTRQLGDAVSNVSPQAGDAIGDVGGALDQAIGGPNPSLHP
jgi:hypothetical protein